MIAILYTPTGGVISVAPLGDMLEIYDYLLQHGAYVDILNATRHLAHYVKT